VLLLNPINPPCSELLVLTAPALYDPLMKVVDVQPTQDAPTKPPAQAEEFVLVTDPML